MHREKEKDAFNVSFFQKHEAAHEHTDLGVDVTP